MERKEWHVTGSGGLDIYMRAWLPEQSDIRGAVAIVHGMGEHGERYVRVAEQMVEAGLAVTALDLCGHGLSEGKRGHVASLDGAVEDVCRLIEETRRAAPNCPIFLYGHSMGGNLVINCALRKKPAVIGVISTSPWLRLSSPISPLKIRFARMTQALLPTLSQSTKLKFADLYRPGYVSLEEILNDPLYHTAITIQTYLQVSDGGEWILSHAHELDYPLLLMHGNADQITSMEASLELAKKVTEACEWHIWPEGRHELHNDLEGREVVATIIGWMKRQL